MCATIPGLDCLFKTEFHSATLAGLELTKIHLLLPPECWCMLGLMMPSFPPFLFDRVTCRPSGPQTHSVSWMTLDFCSSCFHLLGTEPQTCITTMGPARAEGQTQDFLHARQTRYQWKHTPSGYHGLSDQIKTKDLGRESTIWKSSHREGKGFLVFKFYFSMN